MPTGIYREPWVPRWAHEASEDRLFEWMVRELEDEIEGTGVRAGWIKLSAGDDGLTAAETKILRAAARASNATDCVIGSHTIKGRVVRDQLDILDDADVPPDRFIWIHTQAEPDVDLHLEIARRALDRILRRMEATSSAMRSSSSGSSVCSTSVSAAACS